MGRIRIAEKIKIIPNAKVVRSPRFFYKEEGKVRDVRTKREKTT
jgi:hypothetical protein